MATSKQSSSAKKPSARTTKRPATSKPKTATAKTTTHRSKGASKAAASRHRMFAVSLVPETQPFFTFKVTRDTLHWLIFSAAILALGLWVLQLNSQVMSLYDQIDSDNAASSVAAPLHKPVVKK